MRKDRFLSLSGALEAFPSLEKAGLGEHDLLKMIKNGSLSGFYDKKAGGWRVSMDSLVDELHLKYLQHEEIYELWYQMNEADETSTIAYPCQGHCIDNRVCDGHCKENPPPDQRQPCTWTGREAQAHYRRVLQVRGN